LIKSKIDKKNRFDFKVLLKKLFTFGCRNLLIEGGNELTKNALKKKLFNQFYLFKSPKILSKFVEHKEFKHFKDLSENYKSKYKINTNIGKDLITLYKK